MYWHVVLLGILSRCDHSSLCLLSAVTSTVAGIHEPLLSRKRYKPCSCSVPRPLHKRPVNPRWHNLGAEQCYTMSLLNFQPSFFARLAHSKVVQIKRECFKIQYSSRNDSMVYTWNKKLIQNSAVCSPKKKIKSKSSFL